MLRNLNSASVLTGENIVRPIALIIDVLGTHKCANTAVVIISLQVGAILVLIVAVVEQIVGGAALVFLSCIELVLLDFEHLCLLNIVCLHVFKSADFSCVPLFSQVSPSILHMLELLMTNFLVCDGEIFIEALLLGDEVTRCRVWVVHLGRVHIFVVTACTLAQSRILNQFFVFHGSLHSSKAIDN